MFGCGMCTPRRAGHHDRRATRRRAHGGGGAPCMSRGNRGSRGRRCGGRARQVRRLRSGGHHTEHVGWPHTATPHRGGERARAARARAHDGERPHDLRPRGRSSGRPCGCHSRCLHRGRSWAHHGTQAWSNVPRTRSPQARRHGADTQSGQRADRRGLEGARSGARAQGSAGVSRPRRLGLRKV